MNLVSRERPRSGARKGVPARGFFYVTLSHRLGGKEVISSMPKLVPEEIKEHAYQLYRTGSKPAEIAEVLNAEGDYKMSTAAVQGWMSRYQWTARLERDQIDEQTGKVRKANDSLFLNAGLLMERAIDLAFNAESETVRAAQQRYLLSSLGISPETAGDRLKALAIQQDRLKQLTEQPILEINDALAVVGKVDAGGDW